MSFFGFDPTRGHDSAAPGFSQAADPFSGLSGNNVDDVLEFEDTYDGLGDQLDETDDAFNDDTFGGGDVGPAVSKVGKDFDFFGQTAKVAGAIEEEHLRFHRQGPTVRSGAIQSQAAYYGTQPGQPAPDLRGLGMRSTKNPSRCLI
uniref:mRNA decay factor PAT1 domain-containing protein n=1 Tax=Bionectria ochroleuca TaxID=29856 RepID=A0A8H7K719_BIOOC